MTSPSGADILAGLWRKAERGESLLAAGVGTGLVAASAERAGADLLVVYNSGLYRTHGHASLAGMMPYGDANEIVQTLGRHVLSAVHAVPVLAGVCATDPFRRMDRLLPDLVAMGFSGVQNFPTVALIDGRFRQDLEASGIDFATEIRMIEIASSMGLLACAFVGDPEEAAGMAQAGAQVIAAHLGVTRKGADPLGAAERVQEMRDAAVAVNRDVLVLFHGGPFATPTEVAWVLAHTSGVAGYFAASSVERDPVEQAVTGAVKSLAATPTNGVAETRAVRAPLITLDEGSLPAYLADRGLIKPGEDVSVSSLGGGISNVLLLYESATRRGVIKQGLAKLRVKEDWYCDVSRVLVERDAIAVAKHLLPADTTPAVVYADPENYLFVMDPAPADAVVWRAELLTGRVDVDLCARAGTLLGRLHVGSAGDNRLREAFRTDMLGQLRIEPYFMATAARHPDLKDRFEFAVRVMLTRRRALVHGDYVPKNMLITRDRSIVLLDYEIAHFGNPAYDVATFTNHLLLKAFAMVGEPASFHDGIRGFLDAYRGTAGDDLAPESETLTLLGALMLARVDGKSPVDYLDSTETKNAVRQFGRALLGGTPTTLGSTVDSAFAAM